ncbi:MAG: histidinol-phosphatase [Deltaproteobacteria bacterium]|nr:histidinol-phosphatase [Deltaproteobacteria bacterium]
MKDRHAIASVLIEMAHLLEMTDANPFRIRSYTNAARILEGMVDFEERMRKGTLTEIKGIGTGMAAHILECATQGTIAEYESLRKEIPDSVRHLLAIPGLGPKKILQCWKSLQITTLEQLAAACHTGRVATLSGMGKKTEEKILEGIAYLQQQSGQHLFPTALAAAVELVELLRQQAPIVRLEIAGSLRRHNEVVKDIDLVASSADVARVMQGFVSSPLVSKILQHGETKSSVSLQAGINADLRCVDDRVFPCALLHCTGSKAHNTALRGRAVQRGMTLNEYGLFRRRGQREIPVPCADEAAIYAALDLAYIPTELREEMGEIAAAENGTLPVLVEAADIRGVLHCHTSASDGRASLEEMVAGARERGYQYLGISDHSQVAAYAGGLTPAKVRAQWTAIDRLGARYRDVRILSRPIY